MRPCFSVLLALSGLALTASAQQWEVGGLGGFAFTPKWSAKTAAGAEADAGFKTGGFVGAWGAHNARQIGGEIRYLYRYGSGELTSGSAKTSFGANQQLVTYSVLWHFTDRGQQIRPYFAFGGGARWIRGTGRQLAFPPLFQYAAWVQGTEVLPVVDLGIGVKIRAGQNGLIRLELRDYLGPIPSKVVSAAPGATMSGWYNDLMPTLGLGFTW